MLRVLNDVATRDLEMAQELLLLVCQASAEERVTTFLVNWRNRLASPSTSSPVLTLPMRRQDIADFLGLTLETVSRTFAKLHDKGIIRIVPKGVVL
jgi:CRP/FNR family transcriptional regulator, anaerobic regulatory protein